MRKLVPLTDLMTFLEFTSPGANTVLASIVWDKARLYSVKDTYLARDRHGWEATVCSIDEKTDFRQGWLDQFEVPAKEVTTTMTVDVPQGCFVEEPAEWEKKWVNLMWRDKTVDQCDFRKRRMWARRGHIYQR